MATTDMKAVVYHGPGDVRCQRTPVPPCGDGELRVKVDACAVCGSDWKAFKAGNPRMKPPITIGHEFTGLIETVGGSVNGFTVGQRVVMATSVSCGRCLLCQRGWTNLCTDLRPMGILNACVAREYGAGKIIVSEPNPVRLRQAEVFGFDRLVNPAADDLHEVVMQETGGYGADVVIVAAPAAPPQEQAVALTRKRGTVCLFASLPAGDSMLHIDSRPIHYNELRMVGSSDSTSAHVEHAVRLIAGGALPMDALASHMLTFDDIHRAFALMESGEALRVVLSEGP